MELLIGFAVGGIVIGIIAHRKPEWFAQVVKIANAVDYRVNTQIKK